MTFFFFSTFPLWLQSFWFPPPPLPSPIDLIFPKFPIFTEFVLQLKHNVSSFNYFMTSFIFQNKHREDISTNPWVLVKLSAASVLFGGPIFQTIYPFQLYFYYSLFTWYEGFFLSTPLPTAMPNVGCNPKVLSCPFLSIGELETKLTLDSRHLGRLHLFSDDVTKFFLITLLSVAFPVFYRKDKTGSTNIQSWGWWVIGRTRTTFPSLWFPDHMIQHAAKLVFQCDFPKQKLQYFFRSSTALSALSKWEKGDTCKESLLECFPFVAFQHTIYLNQIQPVTLNSNVATLWTDT